MKIYDLTTGLQAVLLHFQRGYVLTTECPIVVHAALVSGNHSLLLLPSSCLGELNLRPRNNK